MTTEQKTHLARGTAGVGRLVGQILVVDDEQIVRAFVQRILEHEGHRVLTADSLSNAKEALGGSLDVAVLDVDLPDGEGFDLVQLLRERSATPTPIVMITGNPNEDSLSKSAKEGIDEFLFKPFRAEELKDAVERALQAKLRWQQRVGALEGRTTDPEAIRAAFETPETIPGPERETLVERLVRDHGLTGRERETLEEMLAGLQNAAIAKKLNISANTVKYHVRNVLTKLGVESRTALFRSLVQDS